MAAIVSSHLLNGIDGTHAGGVRVTLSRLDTADGTARTMVFDSRSDSGGRLQETVDDGQIDVDADYELQIYSGEYWKKFKPPQDDLGVDGSGAERKCSDRLPGSVCRHVVFRFSMPDAEARYHIPFIISPNCYSVWWSAPE